MIETEDQEIVIALKSIAKSLASIDANLKMLNMKKL